VGGPREDDWQLGRVVVGAVFAATHVRGSLNDLSKQGLARRGEERDLIQALYQDSAADLSAYVRRQFGAGPPDPDEVAQEAFTRLFEQKDLSAIENLRGFLWRTARNLVLTHKRQVEQRSKYDFEVQQLFFTLDGPGLSPENVLKVKQQLKIINEVLAEMPERRRKALLWHRVDGLNFTAIGKRLGINRRAVARNIAKAALEIQNALKTAQQGEGL